MRAVLLLTAAAMSCWSITARAQSGWERPLYVYDSDKKADLPAIKQPQPQWAKVVDIQATDGTTTVPTCGDPDVVASVRDGILHVINQVFESISRAGGFGRMFNRINMEPVWVHPAYSGGYVCNTEITLPEMPDMLLEHWKFQTFAKDGKALVFFYDEDGERDFGR